MDRDNYSTEMLSQNKLIVGNPDSILMFGCEEQQMLREFSKTISNQFLNGNLELEYLIHDILNEIDDFQRSVEKKQLFFVSSNEKKRASLIKKYNAILVYMDKMELALELQEAQLIKDSKLYENLSQHIDDTVESLKTAISYGYGVVEQKPNEQVTDDINNWYERLSKRISDLEISYTAIMQIKVQLNLMMENNTQLVDRILGAISGTIPIWRNQITLLLGIEKLNRNQEIPNKVTEITQKYISEEKAAIGIKRKNQKELSIEKLINTNETLKKALDELDSVEKQDGKIRLELSSSLS